MIAETLLADLDRCEHGRHDGDPCFGCPDGVSPGNPHMRPGQVIGYGLDGIEIVVTIGKLGKDDLFDDDIAALHRRQQLRA